MAFKHLCMTAIAAIALAGPAAAKPATGCNEACLLKIAGDYMDALTANDPSTADLAAKVRATENGVVTPVGDGVWKTASSWSYRHTFVDLVSGQIGVMGSIREGADKEAMLAIRLKVVGRKVTESELLVTRKGDFALFDPRWTAEPKPVFKAIVAPGHRSTRAQLAQVPKHYFDAIAAGDPSLVDVHPDAVRVENGYQTTSNPARGSASVSEGLRRLVYMQKARQLRTPVIDVERGLVWAIVAVDMPKMDKTITVRGKPVEVTSAGHGLPRSLVLYELFKVEDGHVTAVEAVMRNAPLGADLGWAN